MPTFTKAPKEINFSQDPIYVEITTDKIINGAPTEDNLSCYVAVYKKGTPDQLIVEINPPYYKATAIADFDVSKVLDLHPKPPTFAPATSSQQEDSMFFQFFMLTTDIFGTPPELDSVIPFTPPYVVIAGGTRYLNGLYSDTLPAVPAVLHAWYDENGNIFFKEVRKEQREFIYFYTHAASTADVKATFYYTDGTNDEETVASVSTAEKTVNSIEVGYNKLDLDTKKDNQKELAYYTLQVGTGETLYYVVDEILNDNDQYFMHFNGIGGMEVFRSSGFETQEMNTKSNQFESVRWKGSNFEDGFVQSYGHRGRKTKTINSGYYSKAYCEHLQQLIFGDIWHINEKRNQFEKYNVLSSSLQVYDDLNDLFFIEIKIAPAFYSTNFSNFRI